LFKEFVRDLLWRFRPQWRISWGISSWVSPWRQERGPGLEWRNWLAWLCFLEGNSLWWWLLAPHRTSALNCRAFRGQRLTWGWNDVAVSWRFVLAKQHPEFFKSDSLIRVTVKAPYDCDHFGLNRVVAVNPKKVKQAGERQVAVTW